MANSKIAECYESQAECFAKQRQMFLETIDEFENCSSRSEFKAADWRYVALLKEAVTLLEPLPRVFNTIAAMTQLAVDEHAERDGQH